MKKFYLFSFILFSFCISALAQKSAHYGAPKFAPTDGKKLLIIGQDLGSVGGLTSHSTGYIDSINQHFPAGITTYTDIPNLGGLTSQRNWGAGDVNAQAYVNDSSFNNSFLVIGLYMVGRLDGIKDGFFNNKIRDLALWCKGQNRPIFLRIGYEFEGPWNNYAPTSYKAAWRQIVHVFDQEDVRNVAYVWQSAGLNRSDIDRWYPGDEYVNWVGYSEFDSFNMGQSIRDFAVSHNKPIMIAEATPRRQLKAGNPEGHWLSWYAPLFTEIYGNDRIKALAYINADWEAQSMWAGQGWGDSRVHVVDYIENLWLTEMAKDAWLMASDSLFDSLQYQSWIDSVAAVSIEPFSADKIEVFKDSQNILIKSQDRKLIDKVQIWDVQARVLYQSDPASSHIQIPIDQWAAGVILIFVEIDGRLYRKKAIIGTR